MSVLQPAPAMLIDVTRLIDRALQGRLPTGVDRVGLAYLAHFGTDALALVRYARRWLVFSPADSRRVFAELALPAPGRDQRRAWRLRWLVARALLRFPDASRLAGCFLLNTGHSGLDAPDYGERVRRYGLRPLFFVHDLIPLTHPEYCRAGETRRHRARMDTALRYGHGLIVNSGATRQALADYASESGLPLPPAVVAPLAPAVTRRDATPPLNEAYFVMLGTLEPRKNHVLILQLWRELVERSTAAGGAQTPPHLVLIGQVGWECENVLDLLERCPALQGYVHHRAACTDTELAAWLGHARALLFPSFAEGFGMPLVEALALGTPVLASDLPVFREVAGGIPDYFSPLDGVGWAAAIREYARPDSHARAAQLARMQGYQPPGWGEHFARVDALIAGLEVHA